MLSLKRIAAWLPHLLIILSAGLVQGEEKPPAEQPLSLREIARLRHDRTTPEKIIERAGERGIAFPMTPGNRKQLQRWGFDDDQIDALQQAAAAAREKPAAGAVPNAPPIVPGQGLSTSDAQRQAIYDQVAKITKLSGANVEPVQTRHLTLWAGKDDRAHYLPDLKKIESFLETNTSEPLRSGLDKRSAHLVLLATRYDYEKWVHAMFDVIPDAFKLPDAPGDNKDLKAAILKWSGYYTTNFAVVCLEGQEDEWLHRTAAVDVGFMNFMQQAEPGRHDPLATGFANGIETLLFGQPRVMLFSNSYHNEDRDLGNDARAWLHLVQDRMRTNKVTGVRALLAMDTTNMLLPHYAEVWTLVGVLARQPEKFGKLLIELREEKDALTAIEKIYGWDEKKLEDEWRKEVLAQR